MKSQKGVEIPIDAPIMNRFNLMKDLETLPEVDEYIELVRLMREHGVFEDKLYVDKMEQKNITIDRNFDIGCEDYSKFCEPDDWDYWMPITRGMNKDSVEYKVKLCRALWILSRFPEYETKDWVFLMEAQNALVLWLREFRDGKFNPDDYKRYKFE